MVFSHTNLSDVPEKAKGAYILILHVKENLKIRVGCLGLQYIGRGYYAYVGSAQGRPPQNLKGRLKRHVSREKKARWHIDYLTLNRKVIPVKAVIVFSENMEHELSKMLESTGGEPVIKGFGATDCKAGCYSHLYKIRRIDDAILKISDNLQRRNLRFAVVDLR